MLINYIETAKKRHNLSQNRLADRIGISGAALSKICNGGKASEETIVVIAKLAGEKPEKVLADYKLSVGDMLTPEVKSMWQRISGNAAALCVGALTIGQVGLNDATPTPTAEKKAEVYILCKIVKLWILSKILPENATRHKMAT